MRRFFLAATIMSIVAGGPLQALAGDREIAEQIIQKLKVQRDSGSLKDFTLDLKVDKGVVVMRGSVREEAQKQGVLAAASGIEGVEKVQDEITIGLAKPAEAVAATVVKPKAAVAAVETKAAPKAAPASTPAQPASMKEELSKFASKPAIAKPATSMVNLPEFKAAQPVVAPVMKAAPWQAQGAVQMAAATEATSVETDREITSKIVTALSSAQKQGRLKGFGVDVNTQDGRVFMNGRASNDAQRQLITSLARQVPGVVDVVDEIAVYGTASAPQQADAPMPLSDYRPEANGAPDQRLQALPAAARTPVQAQAAPYQMQPGMGTPAMQAGMYGGAMGGPVPMGPYAGGAAAPRYEQPYMPNYAWPGYAAYPNYAAVTYPQQYSPSAWPYIGPFYPYPQVPLGWRKVSLEWDDGWWMLDFTDRH